MRYRITTVSLIFTFIMTFQIHLVSEAFMNPSKETCDLTVNQSAGIGATHYVDSNQPQAQGGSSPNSRDAPKRFQVFLPFVSKEKLLIFHLKPEHEHQVILQVRSVV
jgi:hypothetical protein